MFPNRHGTRQKRECGESRIRRPRDAAWHGPYVWSGYRTLGCAKKDGGWLAGVAHPNAMHFHHMNQVFRYNQYKSFRSLRGTTIRFSHENDGKQTQRRIPLLPACSRILLHVIIFVNLSMDTPAGAHIHDCA